MFACIKTLKLHLNGTNKPIIVGYLGREICLDISGWWFQPHLKNMSQNGNLFQVGLKIKDI